MVRWDLNESPVEPPHGPRDEPLGDTAPVFASRPGWPQQEPTVGSCGGVVSYERGTPVAGAIGTQR